MKLSRAFVMLVASLLLTMIAGSKTSHANPPVLPNPVLYLTSTVYFTKGGTNYIRYQYDVFNKDSYPDAMFAPALLCPRAARTPSLLEPGWTSLIRTANGYTDFAPWAKARISPASGLR
jgi:hypothetical protein